MFDTLLAGGSLTALMVLAGLGAMSVWSWAAIAMKQMELRRVEADDLRFYQAFREKPLAELHLLVGQVPYSVLGRMFDSAWNELQRPAARPVAAGQAKAEEAGRKVTDRVNRALERAYNQQMEYLEGHMGGLATISSTAPFVGLGGTVMGVIDAFRQIGQAGIASLPAVAPGLSEALVATAAGLATAVPALVAYNLFRGRVRAQSGKMRNFALELLNQVERSL